MVNDIFVISFSSLAKGVVDGPNCWIMCCFGVQEGTESWQTLYLLNFLRTSTLGILEFLWDIIWEIKKILYGRAVKVQIVEIFTSQRATDARILGIC